MRSHWAVAQKPAAPGMEAAGGSSTASRFTASGWMSRSRSASVPVAMACIEATARSGRVAGRARRGLGGSAYSWSVMRYLPYTLLY